MVLLMTDDKLNDSLSAMLDNNADELEVRRVLANMDEETLATWSRYQMVGSVLRKETIFPELNIVSAIAAEIDGDSIQVGKTSNQKVDSSFFSYLGKLAVAASILVVTISTVYLLNNEGFSDTATSAYAQNEVVIDDIGVATTNDLAVDQKVSELIEKHDKQGSLTLEEKEVENISSPNTNTVVN